MWNGTEDKIKVKITWIRHGMTQANGEHRYLGKTDEPLSETGIRLLQEKKKEYFSSPPEFLYTSPMKRCVVTIVHGGTIMAVLSSLTGVEYFDFQVKNGEGYETVLEWIQGRWKITSLTKIGCEDSKSEHLQ